MTFEYLVVLSGKRLIKKTMAIKRTEWGVSKPEVPTITDICILQVLADAPEAVYYTTVCQLAESGATSVNKRDSLVALERKGYVVTSGEERRNFSITEKGRTFLAFCEQMSEKFVEIRRILAEVAQEFKKAGW